jgi:hypothetical protein
MSKRNLLHKSKLEDFKSWLDAEGIQHRAGKGSYQVLQVMTHKGWQVVFDKHTDEHFTVNEVLVPIVTRFIRSKKKVPDDVSDLLEALQLIFKHYDRNNGEAPHHCHAHKAHWDLDDSPCEVCADWEKARLAINKSNRRVR